jgi:hypothetical protein
MQGTTSCATVRRIDTRADQGLRSLGWRCAFSHHGSVTTCTSVSKRAQIQGIEYAPPPVAPTPTPIPPPTPTECYLTTNSENCYEPDEYCRIDDYGVSGVAGDGEAITCEYNNGWRWEPA